MANQRRSKRNKKSDHTKLVPKVPKLEPNGKRKAVQLKKGEEGAHKETMVRNINQQVNSAGSYRH